MLFRASVASCLALLLLVGCGSEEQASEASPGDTTPATTTEPIQTIATVPETAPAIVTVYFLRDGKVGAASRAVVAGPQIGRAAIMELLEGPADSGASRRAANVDSRRHASSKSLSIVEGPREGRAVGSQLTGEIERPGRLYADPVPAPCAMVFIDCRRCSRASRADLEEFSPSVLVESPTPGEQVSSPLRITGTANTFEATFNVEVVDDRGPRPRQALRDRDVRVGNQRDVRCRGSVQGERCRPRQAHRLRAVGRGRIADPRSRDSPANRALTARREHVQEQRVARPAWMLWVADLA